MKIIVLAWFLVLVGLIMVGNDLFPIYQFKASDNWPKVSGTIMGNSAYGLMRIRRCVGFAYRVGSKSYQCTQMMPSDSWTKGLTEGTAVQVRHRLDKPESALIDHFQVWDYLFLACWNSLWIVFGGWLLYQAKHKAYTHRVSPQTRLLK